MNIPNELVHQICIYLSQKDLISLMQTCKKLHSILLSCPNFKSLTLSTQKHNLNNYVKYQVIPNLKVILLSFSANGVRTFQDSDLKSISKFQNLKALDIRNTRVTETGMMDYLRVKCPSDCLVCENGNDGIHTKRLEEINISKNIGVSNMVLETMAIRCPMLKVIDLSQLSRFSDLGIELITKSNIGNNITYLSLNGCDGLTDMSLISIGNSCKRLLTLKCSGIFQIGNRGAISILRGCKMLKHLDFSFCWRITDLSFQILCNSGTEDCDVGVALEIIYLQFCYQLSDESVISFMALPNLLRSNLSNCQSISPSAIEMIREKGVEMLND
jgi:hypothetical protein